MCGTVSNLQLLMCFIGIDGQKFRGGPHGEKSLKTHVICSVVHE